MAIIIEGIDKAGKSTTCKQLSEALGLQIVHFPAPTPDFNFFEDYIKMLLSNDRNIILDRFFYSELVYGPILRNEYNIKTWQQEAIEALLRSHDSFIVYCVSNVKTIHERFIRENEKFVDAKYIEKIIAKYEEVMNQTTLPVIRKNT